MRLPFVTTCHVPSDLQAVTSIHSRAEVPSREVGADPRGVARVWSAVESLYGSGIHPAIQLCVRRRGQIILDRAIGHARGNGPHDTPDTPKVLATPETPFTIFSAAKAVTAMVIHLLDQRNLLRLDDRVAEYIPEFGRHGKQLITIRHLLTHRAGLPNLPPEVMDLKQLDNEARILRILCAAEPTWRPGRQLAYHAITGGFILGEVVRRVTGKGIRAFLGEEILRPLGFRWMNYGVRRADVKRVALNYFTGMAPLPPVSTLLTRAFGMTLQDATEMSNDPRFLTAVIPSANVVATANELSRFYQLLLNGGELGGVRIFEPRTIRRAVSEESYFEIDFTLGVPVHYGLGFMLGAQWFSLYGPDTQHAFGHLGFTNIVSWADPERQVAATLMTSGKPLVYPQLYHAFDIMRQIGLACPKERSRQRALLMEQPQPRVAARSSQRMQEQAAADAPRAVEKRAAVPAAGGAAAHAIRSA
jgi:CubicO group peptidase (beta-lactamase class C family)